MSQNKRLKLSNSLSISDFDDFKSPRQNANRKSKDICRKLLTASLTNTSGNKKNNNDENDEDDCDDSSICEESAYDSDIDPEFKYSDKSDYMSSEENESVREESSDVDSDDSAVSNFTDFNRTFDILNSVLNNDLIPSKSCQVTDAEDLIIKNLSKRKMSEECRGIYGLAQRNLWERNYDEALEQCSTIIREYPSFWGTYDILAQIYEARGDIKKADQLYYTSAMCNPKNIDKWIDCIERTKNHEGIDKAIQLTKLAMTRTHSHQIRTILADLLEEGGHKKEAMKRKLMNFEMAPREENASAIENEVLELFAMSENFEALKDFKRSSKCLEVINMKYPDSLTDKHRMNLLKLMSDVNRYNGVMGVVSNIKGVQVNEKTPHNLLVFTTEIPVEYRQQIIFSVLFAAIHMESKSFIESNLFSDYLKEIINNQDSFLIICNKLYELKHYQIAFQMLKYLIDNTEDKLLALKLLGKCQEALSMDNDALETYDHIIKNINEQEASVWEMKANLLYRLKREEDAIHVLAESQKFIRANNPAEDTLSNRIKPTKESLQLLYKLGKLLYEEKRFSDYIKVAWKFLFIDSFEYFSVNKIEMCCDDITVAKTMIPNIQNNIWLCISKTIDSKGHCVFPSTHLKIRHDLRDSKTWDILDQLIDLIAESNDELSSNLIEVVSQWGLVLQKILNWNAQNRLKVRIIYVVSAIRNRIHDHRLRLDVSGNMIFQELRYLRDKYGESNQFWNLFQIYIHVMDQTNIRFILRNMPQLTNTYPLEMINSGHVLTGIAKLSLAINSKLFFEHRENAQVSLQMAITLANSALARTSRDSLKPLMLAIAFILEYRKLRGECQETFYNMGRFYHRIKQLDVAKSFYEKCLETPPIGQTDHEKSLNDLTREAAFNLIYIYKRAGNMDSVGIVRQKYLTI